MTEEAVNEVNQDPVKVNQAETLPLSPVKKEKLTKKDSVSAKDKPQQKKYRIVAIDSENLLSKRELTAEELLAFSDKYPDIAQLWSMEGIEQWLSDKKLPVTDTNKLLFKDAFLAEKSKQLAEKPLHNIEENWINYALKIMEGVYSNEKAKEFREKVDPHKHSCLDYYDVIKNPMDLTTIQNKLKEGK